MWVYRTGTHEFVDLPNSDKIYCFECNEVFSELASTSKKLKKIDNLYIERLFQLFVLDPTNVRESELNNFIIEFTKAYILETYDDKSRKVMENPSREMYNSLYRPADDWRIATSFCNPYLARP